MVTMDSEKQDNERKISSEDPRSIDSEEAEEDDTEYPPKKVVIPAIIAGFLIVFLVALDRTIIGTAVPSISNEFQSFGDIAWYEAGFLLPLCIFGLSIGRILTFYPTKWILIIEVVIFEVGNVICATAKTSTAVIVGRFVTGLGAAGIVAGVSVLINILVPLSKRPKYSGGLGACFGVSSVLGPLVGGYLTSITWRWVFWINLPIGGVSLLIFILVTPNRKPPDVVADTWQGKVKQLDPVGFALIAPGAVCILLALQWGGVKFAWNSGEIIALFTLSAAFGIAFVCSQIFLKGGTVPGDVASQRSVLAATLQSVGIGSILVINGFYLPIWFQAIKGDTPQGSGVSLLALFLSTVLLVISGGILISRFGLYKPYAIFGGAVLVIGAALLSTWQVDTPIGKWIGYQIILGAGQGFSLAIPNIAVQTVLSKAKAPVGLALLQFTQFLAGSIMIAVCQTLLQNGLVTGLAPLGIDGSAIVNVGATELRSLVPENQLQEVLIVYNDSLRNIWYVNIALSALTFLATFLYENKNVKKEEARLKAERGEKLQDSKGEA